MGILIVARKAFENSAVVVYEVRDNDGLGTPRETMVIDKASPAKWDTYSGLENWASRVYVKLVRRRDETGEWPAAAGHQA